MQTLQLILFIAITGYSLYSIAVYAGRRSRDKNALRRLREHGRAVRTLTADERQLLQPFLCDPRQTKKAVTLSGDQVFELSGAFIRHGLHTNGSDTLHDTLDGVDVVLPYDARDFLTEDNRAEVVLTPKFAIVVRLNDSFDLAGGRQRSIDAQAIQHRWNSGQTGNMEVAAPAEPAAAAASEQPAASPENAAASTDDADLENVQILGQRKETAAEAAARAHPGYGILSALTLAGAFVFLLVAGQSEHYPIWLGISLASCALALWLFWRRRPPAEPQKVNRAEGSLNLVVLQTPDNSAVSRSQLFLGSQLPINLPKHWEAFATVPPDSRVTVEMRVDDYSLVAFGQQLSIDEEERRFPSVRWGRHLTMAITGLAMLLIAGQFVDTPAADLAHVRAALLPSIASYTQADQLLAEPPAVGSIVHVEAQVRCAIPPTQGYLATAVDCRSGRWGGEELRVAEVEAPADLLAIQRGSIVHAASNPMLDMMVQMRLAQMDLSERIYMGTPSLQVISDLTTLILTIDQECHRAGIDNASECARIQDTLGSKLVVSGDSEANGWEALLKQAHDGTLKANDDAAIASTSAVEEVRRQLQDLVTPALSQAYAPALREALASQRGGILLPHGNVFDDRQAVAAAAPAVDNAGSDDWPSRWQEYRRLASPAGLQALVLDGVVIAFDKNADGDTVLMIDPSRNRDNAIPALLRLLAPLLAAGFLLTHGVLTVIGWRRAQQRNRALADYLEHKAATPRLL